MESKKRNKTMENGFWDLYARVYDCVMFIPQYKEMMERVSSLLDEKKGGKLLDAGCGTANLLIFQKHSKINYYGIDDSQSMLQRAIQKKKKISGINATFKLANLDGKLPFLDNTFDKIVAINSIYAVRNPSQTTAELIRILKPGGLLIAVNPNGNTKFFEVYMEIIDTGKNIFGKIKMFLLTFPLFLFNAIIRIKASSKRYHFMNQSEWKNILKDHKVRKTDYSKVYIQSDMVVITK